jgi:hypothetical protein
MSGRLTTALDFPPQVAQAGQRFRVIQNLPEGKATCRGHAAHARVVHQLAPTRIHQTAGNQSRPHSFQNTRHAADALTDGVVHFSDFKKVVVFCYVLGQF